MKKLGLLLVLALMVVSVGTAIADTPTEVPLNPSHVGATNPGFGVGECPTPPEGQEGWWGWHFLMPANNNFTSLTVTFESAGTFSADPFPGGVFVAHPDNSHAYIWTPTPDTLLSGSATSDGENTFFNLSHVCPGEFDNEELTVSKTADTSYIRTHDWGIDKSVDPKVLYLYTDGSGDTTVEWTVTVTYLGFEDSDFSISGEITIENNGNLDAVITAVDDVLAGDAIAVDCGVTFPYTLEVGETLICSYDEDGYVEGFNEVTVTTERDEYFADAEIIWGEPAEELYATVGAYDDSDLFGLVTLGTLDAADFAPGDTIPFTYNKHFAYADFAECGYFEYNNTAKVIYNFGKAGQVVLGRADEKLIVHVQCLIFDGQTAWAANGSVPGELRYTERGNWATYVEFFGEAKTTTLFAGQHMEAGSVSFTPVNGDVEITVSLTEDWEFEAVSENLKVQDYADAPSGNPSPGQFDHKKTCAEAESSCTISVPFNNFYGVHVEVGKWVPDPNFGP